MPRYLLRFIAFRLALLFIISFTSLICLRVMRSATEAGTGPVLSDNKYSSPREIAKQNSAELTDSLILSLMNSNAGYPIHILEFKDVIKGPDSYKWIRGSGKFPSIQEAVSRLELQGFQIGSYCLEVQKDKESRTETLYFDLIIALP